MTEIETLDYLAGFFDAEGYVGIGMQKQGNRARHQARAIVGNADPYVLRMLQDKFGGAVRLARQATDKHREQWVWTHTIGKDSLFLGTMQSRAVIKKRVIDICIEFVKTLRNFGQQFSIKRDDLVLRDFLKQSIMEINQGSNDNEQIAIGEKSFNYWAGLFDGDGTIGVRKNSSSRGPSGSYHLEAHIYSSYRPILNAVARRFGGRVYPNYRGGRAQIWMASHNHAVYFLERVGPHLIQKKAVLEEAMKIIPITDVGPKNIIVRGLSGSRQWHAEKVEEMRRIKDRVTEMNRLGPRRVIASLAGAGAETAGAFA